MSANMYNNTKNKTQLQHNIKATFGHRRGRGTTAVVEFMMQAPCTTTCFIAQMMDAPRDTSPDFTAYVGAIAQCAI